MDAGGGRRRKVTKGWRRISATRMICGGYSYSTVEQESTIRGEEGAEKRLGCGSGAIGYRGKNINEAG